MLQPEGSSLWSSVMGPPYQNSREMRTDQTKQLRGLKEDQIERGEIKTETMKPLSKVP